MKIDQDGTLRGGTKYYDSFKDELLPRAIQYSPKHKPIIITISGEAQHGKDTACLLLLKYIERLGFRGTRIAYADYLKNLATTLYGWDGVKDEKGRSILQLLGQKVRIENPNFWVAIVNMTVETILSFDDYVIIPDTRYLNEIEYWQTKGYEVITMKVMRPNFDNGLTIEQKNHTSETALNDYSFDYTLTNTSLKDLQKQLENILIRNVRT